MWEKQGKTGVFVAAGGQGSDEVVSEAESMRRYLTESRHVPADAVLMEDRSTTTMENLRFSKEIMDARSGVQSVPGRRGLAYRCALVTSDYHVPRALALCKQVGIIACGKGSPSKPEYFIKNHLREGLSWIKFMWESRYE